MQTTGQIRQPAVAGQFYPSAPAALAAEVEDCLAAADSAPGQSRIRALIVPHAGYRYSGRTAGKTFGRLSRADRQYRRALVLAPSHRVACSRLALGPYRAYRTPLGDLPVDLEAGGRLTQCDPLFVWREDAHRLEHSLEVQLPFLQTRLPESLLLPIVCGQLDRESMARAAAVLVDQLWQPETLWVISSDFTHYGAQFGYLPFNRDIPRNLEALDMQAVERIAGLDAEGFLDFRERTGATICGSVPIAILLYALRQVAPGLRGELADYATSGQATGDYCHCVSYVGMTFAA